MRSAKNIGKLISNFERVARTMSSKYDLKVVPSDKCFTDGRTIFYPGNAEMLDGPGRRVLDGWLDHEVGHITEEDRHIEHGKPTPWGLMKETKSKKQKLILNAFEDIRMERVKSKEYAGMAQNLREANIYAAKIMLDAETKTVAGGGKANFWHSYAVGVVMAANGEDTSILGPEIQEALKITEKEIDTSKYTRWASESSALASRVMKKLDDAADEKEDSEDDSEGEDSEDDSEGSEGDSEDSEDDSEGEDSEDDSEGEDSEGDSEDSEGSEGSEDDSEGSEGSEDDSEGDSEGEGSEDSEGDSEGSGGESATKFVEGVRSESKVEDMNDAVKSNIESFFGEKYEKKTRGYATAPEMFSLDRWKTPRKNKFGYETAEKEVNRQIGAMKNKLVALLKTQKESRQINAQLEGFVDDDSLHLVPMKRKDVFAQIHEGEEIDTAVSVLVDESGSMGSGNTEGGKAYYARIATIALGKTFSLLDIPCEIIGFHNKFKSARVKPAHNKHNFRKQPYVYNAYKTFGEKFNAAKYRLGSITGHEDNGDGEAILEVAKRLSMRSEKRKILFVISDGQPHMNGTEQSAVTANLLENVEKITKSGIEVVGFGIRTRTVERFYNKSTGASHLVIDNVAQMAPLIYKTMREMFLKNKRGG